MASPGTLGFKQLAVHPPAPTTGFAIIYTLTDNVVYLQDSLGNIIPLGTASGIIALSGDVTAVGPGVASAVVGFVGGKTASQIAQSVDDTQGATSVNFPNTLAKRDASGNFSAGVITAALTGAASANVLKSGDTMSGNLNMSGNKVTNLDTPTSASDAVRKDYVDSGLALKFDKAGGTITGGVVITDGSSLALVVDGNVFVVDAANNRVGINKLNPTEALDVVGNGAFTGTIIASNLTGTNTGDVTVLDTNSIDLLLTGQQLQAFVRYADTTIDETVAGIRVAPLSLTNSQIALAAAIAYSKLNLANSVTNSDIAATANIVRSKIASGTAWRLVINDAVGAMIDAPAITASRALISDSNGIPTHSAVSDTELSYLLGTTSNIQSQINSISGSIGSLSGDVTGTQSATIVALVGGKTATQVSTSVDDTIAATSAATPSTIVKRDASANLEANRISQSIMRLRGTTENLDVSANPSSSYSLVMPTSQGVAGTFLSNDGLGNLSWTSPVVNVDGGVPDSVFVLGLDVNGGTP
jgi:hypothetical protein